jgi:hypothetical protein
VVLLELLHGCCVLQIASVLDSVVKRGKVKVTEQVELLVNAELASHMLTACTKVGDL